MSRQHRKYPRADLVPEELAVQVRDLPDEEILALHDLCHRVMDERARERMERFHEKTMVDLSR